jgi:hypothetical protein
MHTTPRFLQGTYAFEGKGLAQPVHFRGGNAAPELICVVLMRDGRPMRYFPIAAKGDVHVPLRVVVVDLGLVEI